MANENMDDIWWEVSELDKLKPGDPIKFDYFLDTIVGRVKYIGHHYIGLDGAQNGEFNNMIPRSGVCNVYSTPEFDSDLGI